MESSARCLSLSHSFTCVLSERCMPRNHDPGQSCVTINRTDDEKASDLTDLEEEAKFGFSNNLPHLAGLKKALPFLSLGKFHDGLVLANVEAVDKSYIPRPF